MTAPLTWSQLQANTPALAPLAEGATAITTTAQAIGLYGTTPRLSVDLTMISGAPFAKVAQTGLVVIEPRVFRDQRGFFLENFHTEKFATAGINEPFVQDNHSLSAANVLRGMHYQIQRTQGKLVRAIRGQVFDVAVDLRRNSATYGHWFGTLLTDQNFRMLYVPPGFAHGFCAHTDDTEIQYKCTDLYAPEFERTLIWNDPAVGITWPVTEPIMADRDRQGKPLALADAFA
jgi:dTDP-4-dehydrorhamnose 3,5-epimerase